MVWTDPIAQAWGVARHVLPDRVGARMAFGEAYRRELTQARERWQPARWWASLGWEAAGRVGPVLEAVKCGRLSANQAQELLPPDHQTAIAAMSGEAAPASLPPHVEPGTFLEKVQTVLANLTARLERT